MNHLLSRIRERVSYKWAVVAAFAVIGTWQFGIRLSFGIFFKSIEGEFVLSRAATSSILSLHMILGTGAVVLAGWAIDRYGSRFVLLAMAILTSLGLLLTSQTDNLWQLYITYSLLLAVGTAPIYIITISTISRLFHSRRGMAMGIGSIGVGLGNVVMAPVANSLILALDWRMAFLILGLVASAVLIPISFVVRSKARDVPSGGGNGEVPTPDKGEPSAAGANADVSGLTLREALKTRSLWLFLIVYFLFAASHIMVLTHIVPHVTDIGFSSSQAATVLSCTGIGIIVGIVVIGMVSDRLGRKLTVCVALPIQAIVLIMLIRADTLWALLLFSVLYGFFHGGRGPVAGSLIGETFGLAKIGIILGVIDIGFGVGAVVGGIIFDNTHNYILAFIFAAGAMVISAVLIILAKPEWSRRGGRALAGGKL
ncbi:MFS transporter [Chloroflexota bacterium]